MLQSQPDSPKHARADASPYLDNPLADDTPLPADWDAKLRDRLEHEVATLLKKVQHGQLRGGGTDVYTGYSGVAFFFSKLADLDSTTKYRVILQDAESVHEETALEIAKRYADTAVNLTISATPSGNDLAFLTSPSIGPLSIAAAIDSRSGRQKHAQENAHAVLATARRTDFQELNKTSSELLYGRSGLLYTYRYLSTKCKTAIPEDDLRVVFDTAIQDGIRTSRDSAFRTVAMRLGIQSLPPLMWRFFGKAYLGAAHGVAGILTELLHHPQLLETPMSRYIGTQEEGSEATVKDWIWQTVQWLIPFLHPNFPSSLDSMREDLVQWCHGATGAVVLFAKVLEVFGPDPTIQEALVVLGDVVWEKGLLTKGVGLCHGIGGNAYAFLHIYKALGQERYLNRAVRFALFAMDWEIRTEKGELKHPDHIWSLFEGSSGYGSLLVDLLRLAADRNASVGFPCQMDVPDSEMELRLEGAPVATGI